MALSVFDDGDWVRGRSAEGELVHGYVVSVNSIQETMKIFVINSENKKAIGKPMWILKATTLKLPITSAKSVDELLFLIDLALLTKDKQWFKELTEKFVSIKKLENAKAGIPNV